MALDLSRAEALIALDRADCLDTRPGALARFVRLAWPQIEPNPLVWGWHLDAVCEHLEAVTAGEIRRLVISQPPGTSKSLIASTLWGAWDWLRRPWLRTIAATYAQELSEKNAKLQRDLIRSAWYSERFGDRVRIGKADVDKVRFFKLESKGWRMSTSVGGTVTGFHADVLIGDDLVKAQDAEGRAAIDPQAIERANDFWFKTMRTRRADAARTAEVLIAQRLHHEDTPGKALDAGYTALVLPMEHDPRRSTVGVAWAKARHRDPRTEPGELLCPARFPRAVVDADRVALGPQAFAAQNQQDPTPVQGLLFLSAGEHRYQPGSVPADARQIVTVDCAFKGTENSDFVSIQVWAVARGGAKFYLLDNHTARLGYGATVRAVLTMREKWPRATAIYVEDKANGPAVTETLRAEVPGVIEWSPGSASKVSRAEVVAPLFDSGAVLLPSDTDPDAAPWIAGYLTELRKFPLTKHDDQVDATTMALLILYQPRAAQYIDAVKKMAGR